MRHSRKVFEAVLKSLREQGNSAATAVADDMEGTWEGAASASTARELVLCELEELMGWTRYAIDRIVKEDPA